MIINNLIQKIGKERLIHWVFLFSVSLFCVGIFEFFYIWFMRFQIVGYSRFAVDYSFQTFIVMFIQVYSVLFIPLLSFIGFKYRNSNKFNNKIIKTILVFLLISIFGLLTYKFQNVFFEWIILFMFIFIVMILRFNPIFALSFSYLSFYGANMLFEMQGLNFLKSFGTLLSYLLVFGIYIFILYRLKLKNNKIIYLSFIPIIVYWVYFFDIWQLMGNGFIVVFEPYGWYVRLISFPFYIIITLKIYFNDRKQAKTYIPKTSDNLTKEN